MQTKPHVTEIFVNERNPTERLIVRRTNWGEPFAEGVSFDLDVEGGRGISVDLEDREARRLRDLLNKLLP